MSQISAKKPKRFRLHCYIHMTSYQAPVGTWNRKPKALSLTSPSSDITNTRGMVIDEGSKELGVSIQARCACKNHSPSQKPKPIPRRVLLLGQSQHSHFSSQSLPLASQSFRFFSSLHRYSCSSLWSSFLWSSS